MFPSEKSITAHPVELNNSHGRSGGSQWEIFRGERELRWLCNSTKGVFSFEKDCTVLPVLSAEETPPEAGRVQPALYTLPVTVQTPRGL